jgi:hypothetical protein
MLRRNMLKADCQKSGGKGKTLGLHSTVFSGTHDENAKLKLENHHKKAKNHPQLRKIG